MTQIFLVHGAFVDGSSWSAVIPLLQAAGHDVMAVQLPLDTLTGDIDVTRKALASMPAWPNGAGWAFLWWRRDLRRGNRPKQHTTPRLYCRVCPR